MHGLDEVLVYIKSRISEGERAYVKSADVADAVGMPARAVGARLVEIRDRDDIPVSVEKWSYTGGHTTYAVEVEDAARLTSTISSLSRKATV